MAQVVALRDSRAQGASPGPGRPYSSVAPHHLAALPGGMMSALDRIVPQASQPALFDRLVTQVVLGESDLTWLRCKLGFKNSRNVHYYIEAARWARLIDEAEVRPTSLGRRYVASRCDPLVAIEGLRGRAFFEEVLRISGGSIPDRELVEGVLRRWSFRYTGGTVARRAHDFCRLFGTMMEAARAPEVRRLVVSIDWVEPGDVRDVTGNPLLLPELQLPGGARRKPRRRRTKASKQLPLPLGRGE